MESDHLRPDNIAVLQKLAQLDPAWPARDFSTAQAMHGPEVAIGDRIDALRNKLCRALYVQEMKDSVAPIEEGVSFACRATPLKVDLAGTGLLAAQLWVGYRGMTNFNSGTILILAAQTEKGWYAGTLGTGVTAKWGSSYVSAQKPRPRVLHGNGPEHAAVLLVSFERREATEAACPSERDCDPKLEGKHLEWGIKYVGAVGTSSSTAPSIRITHDVGLQ